jgi:hypothetical protein
MSSGSAGKRYPAFENPVYMEPSTYQHVLSFDNTSHNSNTFNSDTAEVIPQYYPSVPTLYAPSKETKKPAASRGRKRKDPPIHPNPIQEVPVQRSQMRGRNGDPPQSMTGQIKLKGYGRGKLEENPPPPPVLGKGRAARQGTRVDIPNALREAAVAQEKAKRIRFSDDEPLDTTQEDALKNFNPNHDEDLKLVVKKAKSGEVSKTRSHHACDRCWRNKTKVRRS